MAGIELLPESEPDDFVMADGGEATVRVPRGVRRCTLADLWLVCRDMRPDEIEQTLAFNFMDAYDHEAVALSLANQPGPKITIADGAGHAYLCGGAMEVSPGVFHGWMVGTLEGWQQHGQYITRVSRWFMDHLFTHYGARRLQITALSSRTEACTWYQRGLRMTPEGVKRGYGKHGEDCVEFSRLRTDR